MIIRDPATDDYVGIKCEECEAVAPPSSEIIINHGLNRMGWKCSGGTHYCPAHAESPLAKQHLAIRQSDEYFCRKCSKRWAVDEDAPESCA